VLVGVLTLLLAFCNYSFGQDDFIAKIALDSVHTDFAKKGLCTTEKASFLCRHFLWTPLLNEGAIDHQGVTYIFIREDGGIKTSILARVAQKIPETKKLEYLSYLAIFNPNFTKVATRQSVNGIVVLWTDSQGKVLSALNTTSYALSKHVKKSYEEVESSLNKDFAEWIPPEGFSEEYKFKQF
jgi:hypothetical protein